MFSLFDGVAGVVGVVGVVGDTGTTGVVELFEEFPATSLLSLSLSLSFEGLVVTTPGTGVELSTVLTLSANDVAVPRTNVETKRLEKIIFLDMFSS